MFCRCLVACLPVLALFGAAASSASSGCSNAPTATPVQLPAGITQSCSLLHVSLVRSKEVKHFEDYEPQGSSGPVLMQGTSAVNKTASTEGVAPTQQLSVANKDVRVEGGAPTQESRVVDKQTDAQGVHPDCHARWHAWSTQWHAWLLATQNKVLTFVQLGSGMLHQAAKMLCMERKDPLAWMQFMLRPHAAQGTLAALCWIVLALGLGLLLAVIGVSVCRDKNVYRADVRNETSSRRTPNVNMPRQTAKLSSVIQSSQGASPRNTRKEVSKPPPSRTGSHNDRSNQLITAVPENDPPAAACLCRELVVPPNCESCLRLPAKVAEGDQVAVTDMNGCEVMRFVFQKQGSQQQILLTSVYGEILAYCKPAQAAPGEIHVLRAQGEYFGKLVQGGRRDEYVIETTSGAELLFTGSAYIMHVTDAWGRLLAMTEPDTSGSKSSPREEAYVLRVAPLMDVSIAICGLLIINHLM